MDNIATKLTTIADNVQRVYDAGKQAEYDAFWDAYQDNGDRTDYRNAFSGHGWTDQMFDPPYNMAPTQAYMMFRSSKITDLATLLAEKGKSIDFSNNANFQYTFSDSTITHIGELNMSKAVTSTSMVGSNVTTIDKLIASNTTTFNSTFAEATKLVNITFDGVISKNIDFARCSLLSTHEDREAGLVNSVQSIIDHLKDLSSGTAQTLTLHATVAGKLTDEQKATIQAKNWSLVS